jgi:ABC-type antimicrobial peptide transport system permease subunit
MVRTTSDPAVFARTFIAHLQAVDADAAVSSPGPLRVAVDTWLGPRRFTLGLFGAFALTSVVLAISGIYGLVAFSVAQRSREIGVRMAIGASRGSVVRMILAHAGALMAAGVGAGAIVAAAVRPYASALFDGAHTNIASIVATIALLMVTVLVAAWLPARRAARIDPALALRAE